MVKTRQMALPEAPRGVRGALSVGRDVLRADGVKGLYRGLGTVMVGIIPARGVYLTTLEAVKAATERVLERKEAARVAREVEEEAEEEAASRSRREGSVGATSSSSSRSPQPFWSLPRLSEPQKAGAANAVGGAVASLVTQFFTVPVDVVSQRLMIMETSKEGKEGKGGGGGEGGKNATSTATRPPRPPPPPARSGIAMARSIIRAEGVLGLYRGFGASVATFVPSSAVWWSAYGFWQRLIWQRLDGSSRSGEATAMTTSPIPTSSLPSSSPPLYHSSGEILAVQTASALAAGCCSAVLTTPLDVVKTRLQVSGSGSSSSGSGSGSSGRNGVAGATSTAAPSAASVVRQLLREDGFRGLFRGLGPRTASVALWGTCMVNAYEALKRAAATKPAE